MASTICSNPNASRNGPQTQYRAVTCPSSAAFKLSAMEEINSRESLAHELYRAMQRLGAPATLLGIVSSWGDTLSEREVIDMLKIWNETADSKGSLRHQVAANSGYQ